MQADTIHTGHEFQRQHTHANQIGAVDALESFSHDRFDTGKTDALGGPVTRRTLAVVGASNNDQRLLALHIGLDGFPHARHFAFRLDTRQRTGLDLAVLAHHFIFQGRIGEGRTLGRQVIAPMCRVGIEVFLRQTHFCQVLTGCAVRHDGVRRRQMVCGDIVAEHRQRTHAGQRPCAGQRAFPIRRAPDIGGLRTPVVQSANLHTIVNLLGEHRDVHLTELFRLDAGGNHGVDFCVRRPDIFQRHRLAICIDAQHILFDVETDGAGNRVGHHQRRRSQKGLLRVRMDAAIEVAVTRQHRRRIQVALHHFLLYHGIERAGHAVAGSTCIRHHAETQLLQFRHQLGFLQVECYGFGAGRQ